MMARTQITLPSEVHRRARQRASELGVSLAEYVRHLVGRDLASAPRLSVDVACVFDLGSSGGSNVAKHKDSMLAEAFRGTRTQSRRRRPPRA